MASTVPKIWPEVVAATARVRSSFWTQVPMSECVEGIVTPSPRPMSTRQQTRGHSPSEAESGVSSVKRDQSTTPTSSTFRPPQRAAAQPPSTWVMM